MIGEAGIGKSALLAEIDRMARERGLPVLQRRAAVQERYVAHATVNEELVAQLDEPAVSAAGVGGHLLEQGIPPTPASTSNDASRSSS